MESIRQIVSHLLPDHDPALFELFQSALPQQAPAENVTVLDEAARERYWRRKSGYRTSSEPARQPVDTAC